MTVKELIALLEACDPGARVIASVRDGEEVRKVQEIDSDSSLSVEGGPTVMLS
jgi:hypothetical protein